MDNNNRDATLTAQTKRTSREQFHLFMAYCVLIATPVNSLMVLALDGAGIFYIPFYHAALVAGQGILSLGLVLLVRHRKDYLSLAVWLYIASLVMVGLSTDLLVVDDPFRFTWHFATNAAALAIGGLGAGIFVTATSIVSIVTANFAREVLPLVSLATLCSALIVTFLVSSIVVSYIFRVLHDLQASRDALSRLAHTDTLTELPNRLAFEQYLEVLIKSEEAFSLVILDLDRFKRINDTYGHGVGDMVLREIATVLDAAMHPGDMAARLGGEEFCILLGDTDLDTVLQRVEEIRRRIENRPILIDNDIIYITASFGITHTSAPHKSGSTLLSAADEALYKAKHDGRNRSRVAA